MFFLCEPMEKEKLKKKKKDYKGRQKNFSGEKVVTRSKVSKTLTEHGLTLLHMASTRWSLLC